MPTAWNYLYTYSLFFDTLLFQHLITVQDAPISPCFNCFHSLLNSYISADSLNRTNYVQNITIKLPHRHHISEVKTSDAAPCLSHSYPDFLIYRRATNRCVESMCEHNLTWESIQLFPNKSPVYCTRPDMKTELFSALLPKQQSLKLRCFVEATGVHNALQICIQTLSCSKHRYK